ncbi:MAG: efflux RND transporter periplasmic adaptor subunit [Ottowia sp.]|nr:efflux RND transporter periplasmic adaptor subunit [Ottowia sp.]
MHQRFLSKRSLFSLLLIVLLVLAGIWIFSFAPSASKTPTELSQANKKHPQDIGTKRAMPVVAAPVKVGTMVYIQDALGTVTPLHNVIVHTRVDGELKQIAFQEGQRVKVGQRLASIDPRAFQAALAQAQGQLEHDAALLRTAQLDLERYRTLLAQDAIAKQQFDTQVELVKQYEGTVHADKGVVANAQLQLSFTEIISPIDGRIGLRQVDPGNIVHASDTNGLFTITQTQPTSVLFAVPENALNTIRARIKTARKLAVQAWDREGKTKLADGVLQSVDNQIDPSTGTIKLRAQFDNPAESLFPNQFVNIKLILEIRDRALLIPVAAVLRGTPGTYVYVIEEAGTVTVRPVILGREDAHNIEILSGLSAGEKVVVEGSDKLREGAKVIINLKTPPTSH